MAEQRQLADLDDEQRMERMIEQQLQAMQHLHDEGIMQYYTARYFTLCSQLRRLF